jgi:hypothetical protein
MRQGFVTLGGDPAMNFGHDLKEMLRIWINKCTALTRTPMEFFAIQRSVPDQKSRNPKEY